MYNIKVREEAEKELKEAYDWYELVQENLGKRLVLLVREYINALKDNPEQYQRIHKKKRAVNLKDFPYQIIYAIYKNDVVVYSVFHSKRNPKIWKTRK